MGTEVQSIPFGKHAGELLTAVPTNYLTWLAGACKLSSGLRSAVPDVARRGETAPPAPPRQPRSCSRCREAGIMRYRWHEDSLGRRKVRASCARCGGWCGFVPSEPPYTTEADNAASPTAILDVMTECEERGIGLRSDGKAAELAPGDWQKAPPALRDKLRSVRHSLAGMIGRGA